MILINDILVDEKIGVTDFACDLTKCKGACCTFPGEYGAPVLEEEIEQIINCLPHAVEYLSERSVKVLEDDGIVTETEGLFHTVCIDKKDCVFVYYENDIALCSLEKAYTEGKTNFRKPVSCHLFPVRVANFGGKYIYYEQINECNPALAKGRTNKLKIYDSVKDALIRNFGEDWYNSYLSYLSGSKS
ncbi:MAG: DUF3109 family protein [Candidatus Kapaibacterium sp.]